MTSTKIVGQLPVGREPTLNEEQIRLLRRRAADRMCKDTGFCIDVIRLALQAGQIKHHDVIAESELRIILSGKY